jgi:hypothetical protein
MHYNKVGGLMGGLIVSLVLVRRQIGNRGCAGLARGLEDNRSLIALDIFRNDIGDEGATKIGNALATNRTLRTLNLSTNM